jgi:hypothetical protein
MDFLARLDTRLKHTAAAAFNLPQSNAKFNDKVGAPQTLSILIVNNDEMFSTKQ